MPRVRLLDPVRTDPVRPDFVLRALRVDGVRPEPVRPEDVLLLDVSVAFAVSVLPPTGASPHASQ